ncbi:hypothetical protein [Victivallis vadensis]|uniref:hypothetical protein n=1 Tax=Victivallis vadensis TaxID=172901 RepID=UPI003D026C53
MVFFQLPEYFRKRGLKALGDGRFSAPEERQNLFPVWIGKADIVDGNLKTVFPDHQCHRMGLAPFQIH